MWTLDQWRIEWIAGIIQSTSPSNVARPSTTSSSEAKRISWCVLIRCGPLRRSWIVWVSLLFHGPPGTGKTSAIKAIANYMQMNLIIVPMSKIRTRRQLEDLFYDKEVCWIPFDKRIYVFEEIDCNGWESVVRDRALPPLCDTNSTDSLVTGHDLVEVMAEAVAGPRLIQNANTKRKKAEEEDKLTLGALLEVLDGIVESPGRIVIMTTNHRDYLDPALRRPGRIDMEIAFGRLGRQEINETYKHMWGMPIPAEKLSNIPEGRYVQAELAQILYKYAHDPNKFLDVLIE